MRYNSYQRGKSRRFSPQQRHYSNNRSGNRRQHIDPSRFIKKATVTAVLEAAPQHSFSDFALHEELRYNVAMRGYEQPTPIQDQTIPLALAGRDVVGVANTGTGKTAAFILPIINKLLENPRQQVLIIVPTRELGQQIRHEFRLFSEEMRLYSTVCIGGEPIRRQIFELDRNPHLIIGTPGRICDLIERRRLRLERCQTLVLDEVDRMVDMGFLPKIKEILSQLPENRQSLFFSATTTPKVEEIMNTFLRDPVIVRTKTGDTADNVHQDVIRLQPGQNKTEHLHKLLAQPEIKKVLIFGETKRGVEKLSQDLYARGVKSVSIHGNKSQSQRQQALRLFRDNEADVMVATDVAARGLDIADITHVINYDIPQTYDDYVHRIGRAGRANNVGYALTFIQ